MKRKILITLITGFTFLHFSYGQCADVQMLDIYTPMGNLVSTWLMCEEDLYWRQWDDDYWSSTYPNAEKIIVYDNLSSTRKFNCHGYAWLRVEQGIDRWIGYSWSEVGTYPDIYMNDNSYVQVSTETYPGKVFWDRSAGGDHSAVTTNQQGWFISKWNQYPLFKHRWDDSPYGTSFKYFVKNPNVSCISNFSNRTVPTNTTITGCSTLALQNVIVTDNAKFTINSGGEVTFSDFEVTAGSELDLK